MLSLALHRFIIEQMLSTEANILASPVNGVTWELSRQSRVYTKALQRVKQGIWIYLWLLLFEGALRKWILPGLATPLLIIRDPIAIVLLAFAYSKGILKSNNFITAAWILGGISMLTTLLLGHGNFLVAIYGVRVLWFHFPLIFLIGSVLQYEDLIKIGNALLWVALLQTVVIGLQFYSPQSAWINKGVGGEEVSGFSGGLGHFRPSGTFSFTNGVSNFYTLITPIILSLWFKNEPRIKKWLLISATFALIAAIPLSISRTIFFNVLLSGGFVFVIAAKKPKMLPRLLYAVVGLAIILFILSNIGFFQTGVAAFTNRFETATDVKGNGVANTIADRVFGGMISAIEASSQFPFFGSGLGLGTNVGAQLTTGKISFLISEGEWGRLIGEMGILLGLVFILLRVSFAINLIIRAISAINRNNYLPWLLLSFSFLSLIQSQWAQPTSLGFSIIAGGITLAALNSYQAAQKNKA